MKKVIMIGIMLLLSMIAVAKNADSAQVMVLNNELEMRDSVIATQDSIIKVVSEQVQSYKKELEDNLWGGVSPVTYLSGLIFALIGIFINTTVITRRAIKNDKTTPAKWDWKYWWADNKERIVRWMGTLAMIFIAMRFSADLFNKPLTMVFCFMLGFGLDWVYDFFRKMKPKIE